MPPCDFPQVGGGPPVAAWPQAATPPRDVGSLGRILPMPGLATTFDLLANTENGAANSVLVAALDASQREVRDLALTALLSRRNAAAETNLLRRWPQMTERWKTQIADRPGWLSAAIHTVVVNREAALYECACLAAVFTRDYDSIPCLAAAAADPENPHAALAAGATLELTEQLAEELAGPRDYRIRRDPTLQRNHVLAGLEGAATRLEAHGRRELLEAFLLLANRENAVLKRILQSPTDTSFAPLVEILMTSSRPGIERLLLTYLDDLHAPLAALQIIGRRLDVSFLRQLTKKIGDEPTPIVRSNLKRIESIPWIASNLSMLDALREAEQPGVVHLAVSSAAPRQQVLEVVAYILRHGKVLSRRIAAKALADFSGPTADELVIHLMDDEDAVVRAAAASQLRPRNLPGAIQRLLALLESPHEVERNVAQAALAEFTLERFAANFEQMSPQNRFATGLLIRRVDPTAIPHLRSEIEAPSRGRRVRALELTVAIGGVELLQEPIAALIKDDDQFLRMEAIRTLATIDTPMSRQALRDAMLDTQPLVQQAAESALAAIPRSDAPMT